MFCQRGHKNFLSKLKGLEEIKEDFLSDSEDLYRISLKSTPQIKDNRGDSNLYYFDVRSQKC